MVKLGLEASSLKSQLELAKSSSQDVSSAVRLEMQGVASRQDARAALKDAELAQLTNESQSLAQKLAAAQSELAAAKDALATAQRQLQQLQQKLVRACTFLESGLECRPCVAGLRFVFCTCVLVLVVGESATDAASTGLILIKQKLASWSIRCIFVELFQAL